MSDAHTLNIGDASFAKTFSKVSRSDDGAQLTASFKAPKGQEFVVLLLGTTEAGQSWVDVEKMLNELGFYYKEQAE